jgi:hypothetical protein
MYNQGLHNGQPFFTQPGGPGTKVIPTQENAQPWPDYPVQGLVINEYNPWWSPGCGHSIKFWMVVQEWDYGSGQSVALVCCSVCSYVQNAIEPASEWLNPIQRAIIVG